MALGGLGRGELAPASDIDLLIHHDGTTSDEVAALAERVFYPLWDAGLTVGHAVRTADECALIAAGAARHSDGDARLSGACRRRRRVGRHARATARTGARGPACVRRSVSARTPRRAASAMVLCRFLLEPDLKDGTGGLRDIHALGWLGIAAGEVRGAATLDGVGLLRAAERRAVDDAEEFLDPGPQRAPSGNRTQDGSAVPRPAALIARAMGFQDEPQVSGPSTR